MKTSLLFLTLAGSMLAQSLAPLNADGVPMGALAPSAIAWLI